MVVQEDVETPGQSFSQGPALTALTQRVENKLGDMQSQLEKMEAVNKTLTTPLSSPEQEVPTNPNDEEQFAEREAVLRQIFGLFDRNAQGMLTGYELFLVYRTIGLAYTRDEADEAMVKLIGPDTDNMREAEFVARKNHNLILYNLEKSFIKDVYELTRMRNGEHTAGRGVCPAADTLKGSLQQNVEDLHDKYEARKREMETLFNTIDLSNDGFVTEHELLALSKAVKKPKAAAAGVAAAAEATRPSSAQLLGRPDTIAERSVSPLAGRRSPSRRSQPLEHHKPISLSQFLTFYRSVIYDLDDDRFSKGIGSFMKIAKRAEASHIKKHRGSEQKQLKKMYAQIKTTCHNNTRSTISLKELRGIGAGTANHPAWDRALTDMAKSCFGDKTTDEDELTEKDWIQYCIQHGGKLSSDQNLSAVLKSITALTLPNGSGQRKSPPRNRTKNP